MRRVEAFVVGAITGGAVMFVYGPRLRQYVDERSRAMRARVASVLGATADTLDRAKRRIEAGLGGGPEPVAIGFPGPRPRGAPVATAGRPTPP